MADVESYADGLMASVSKSQGGAVRGSGPDSAADPKESGDAVTNSTFYTKQDKARDGRTKNKFHEV